MMFGTYHVPYISGGTKHMLIKSHLILFLHNETALGPLSPVLYELQSSPWRSFTPLGYSISLFSGHCGISRVFKNIFRHISTKKQAHFPN